jgi:hypothetical protein
MQYSMNGGYGRMLATQIAAAVGPVFGKINVVVSASETDYKKRMMSEIFTPDVDGRVRFFATLEAAYDACLTNEDDIILLAGYATHSLAAAMAWSKSRIHVLGMDGGHRLVQQGAKVELTGDISTAYMIKVTGTRNTFENIKFIQSSTNAGALYVVQAAGEGTLYKNCSFMFGTNSNTDLTTSSEMVCGEDSGTFINCSFGNDNLLSTGARNIFTFDAITGSASGAAGAKNNRFVDCEFIVVTSEANTVLLKVIDTGAVEFLNAFTRPQFHAILHAGAGGVAITNAVQSVSGLTGGSIDMYEPASFNCTNFCSTLNAKISVKATDATATGAEAITPT